MRWSPWIARLACACILIGGFEPFYFRMLGPERARFGAWAGGLPYAKTPGLQPFMKGVREHTKSGDRIAIVTPFTKWNGGYAYALTRSTYILAGRTTVPLVGDDDAPLAANVEKADYLACWHVDCSRAGEGAGAPQRAIVWRDAHGVLVLSGAPAPSPVRAPRTTK